MSKFRDEYFPLKKWKPSHDMVIALHCAGLTNVEVAERTPYSRAYVGQLLNSAQGRAQIRQYQKNFRKRMRENIAGQILDLAGMSLGNIRKTVEADIPVKSTQAKKHQDRVGMDLLGILGYTKDSQESKASSSPTLDRDIQERLVNAVEKSEEAKQLRELPEADSEVVDDQSDSKSSEAA